MVRRFVGAAALAMLGLGAALSGQQSGSVLQDLSVREADAKDGFFSSLWDGSPDIRAGQKVFKAAAPDRRAAIVNALGSFVKAYTRTPLFRERYAKYWEANRPRPPDAPESVADRRKAAEASLREMEDSIKDLPPELRKQMEESVKALKAQQEEIRKDAETQAILEQGVKAEREEGERQYQERLKEYDTEHPKDPDAMIARRLREFLDLSASVNFDAKVVKRGDLMRFEKTEDEERSNEWKLCYRAGREATAAARAFAAAWLKELGVK
jgi:hypothetical protein